ncbi:MAG TPA: type II toxin-antitoxin system HicA family toxin [Myxococcota bacterium]|nr:type II toxin-antitoxin system HicA family toxin [Myxococcota bacterium]
MQAKDSKPAGTSPPKLIAAKWGKPLADAGWTAIPDTIIQNQRKLGLDALDLAILLQLAVCWWSPDRPPFPGRDRIAANIGVTSRTVQRRLNRLAKVGLISKVARHAPSGRQNSNQYGFAGLMKGSHVRLACEGRTPVTVPMHDTLDRGTLRSIIRTVGLEVEEFVALLG